MYTKNDRKQLLEYILAFVKDNKEFECLVQIGSGTNGFTDIYSDIDLMIGCINVESLQLASRKLCEFFQTKGAVYINHRKWTSSVLGISAYFENGLSVDLSFMPTCDIPIRSKQWSLLWSLDDKLEAILVKKTNDLAKNDSLVNEQYHHKFFFLIRKAEKEILRENYIYSDIAINEARQMLLLVEAMVEGKKIHEFKAFHTLEKGFLNNLNETYPKELSSVELNRSKDCLVSMYIDVVSKNDLCKIDDSQFKIINCFSQH